MRRLQLLGTGVSDRLGFVLDREHAAEGADALLAYLAERADGWDLLDLQQLPEGSPAAVCAAPSGLHELGYEQEVCPYVPLPASWEELTARLGTRFRQNLRYYPRRMERDHAVELRRADAASLTADVEAMVRLHQARWRSRGLPGALAGGRVRAFHQAAAPRLLERDWLRLYSLRLDGRQVASLHCLHFRDAVGYYLGGMDPAWARLSPGTVLTAHALREAIAAGAREFDFLRGNEAYKQTWRPEQRINRRRVFWAPRGRGRLTPRLIGWERRLERRLKAWASKR